MMEAVKECTEWEKTLRTETQEAFHVTGQQLKTLRKLDFISKLKTAGHRWEQVFSSPGLELGSVCISQTQRGGTLTDSLSLLPFPLSTSSTALNRSNKSSRKHSEGHFPQPPQAVDSYLSPLLWKHITSHKFPLIITKGKEGQKCSSLLNDPCSWALSIRGKFKAEISRDVQPSSSHKWI